CDCHLDEGDPGLVGERAEGIGGGELCGIGWVGGVIYPGALGASGGACELVLDMVVAIATIHGDTRYLEPILQTALDGLRPPSDVEPA
ncbi:MAG: hypothetical protein ACXVDF_19470, partial [Ktedonobacterales bacterium]